MNQLNQRKETILKAVVQLFIAEPEPVSSKKLLDVVCLGISSATIRNEMKELECLGYITHPHTSAGRIPTDQGYRYYVDYLLDTDPAQHVTELKNLLFTSSQKVRNLDEFLRQTVRVVSLFTNQATVLTYPAIEDLYFRYVNLIRISDRKILIVWASMTGIIQDQIVEFEKIVSDKEIQEMSNFMNKELIGYSFFEMQNIVMDKLSGLKDSYLRIYELAKEILLQNSQASDTKVWVEGASRFLNYPEFQDLTRTKKLFEFLENSNQVASVLKESGELNIDILIGQEIPEENLWDCTVIQKSYFIKEKPVGILSTFGPKRMNYQKSYQAIQSVSKILTDVLKENNKLI